MVMRRLLIFCCAVMLFVGCYATAYGSGSSLTADSAMLQFTSGKHILGFMPGKTYIASGDHALSIEFYGANSVMPSSEESIAGSGGQAPALTKVFYKDLWNGISLTYTAADNGITESTYRIAPGGDVSQIRLRYNVPVQVQKDGSLKLHFESGYLTESAPVAWQEVNGKRIPVQVAFRASDGEIGFSVGEYDRTQPLIIDPVYAWHTFSGGANFQNAYCIAVDLNGNVYVGGWDGTDDNIYLFKLNSSGARQWTRFFGAAGGDQRAKGIAVDSTGNVYVAGNSANTWSGPGSQSPINAFTGSGDIFVLKLDTNGTYQWHTFYGSATEVDEAMGIAADSSGGVYVAGRSYGAWDGPSATAPKNAYAGGFDIVAVKLNSSGAYQWHTFFGSTGADHANGVAVDGSGGVYVAGYSGSSWNGPGSVAPKHAHSGTYDIAILKLNSNGAYQWHTFYGNASSVEEAFGIAASGANVYVAGKSPSAWTGPAGQIALFPHVTNNNDLFVLKLTTAGEYGWHTFYGSANYTSGIAVDGGGNVYVSGYSSASWNGPAGQSPLYAYIGSRDMFILKLTPAGAYQWHALFGSPVIDESLGIAVDLNGGVYAAGTSVNQWNGPAGQVPINTDGGLGSDAVVVKIMQPEPDVYAELICPASVAVGASLSVGVKIHNRTCGEALTFIKANSLLIGNANGTLSGVGLYGPNRTAINLTAPAAVCPAEGLSGQISVPVVTAVNAALSGKAAQVMIEAMTADGQVVASGECMVPVQ